MSDKQYTHHDDRTALEQGLHKLGAWLEANATFLIYGLAGVLAVAAIAVYFQRQPPKNADASAQLLLAGQPEDFQDIADNNEDTLIGHWARLSQANALLNSGITNLFSDRKIAEDELTQAGAAFNRLAETRGLDSAIHERVLLGQAKLAETRCDGSESSVQAAINVWQNLLDEYRESIFKDLAEDRIKRLKDPQTSQFYTWFATHDPQPEDDLLMPGLPGSGVPGIPDASNIPDFADPIELPDFNFPAETEDDVTDSTDDPSDDGTVGDEPLDGEQESTETERAEPEPEVEPSTEEPAKPDSPPAAPGDAEPPETDGGE